jgi:hypothetical protein
MAAREQIKFLCNHSDTIAVLDLLYGQLKSIPETFYGIAGGVFGIGLMHHTLLGRSALQPMLQDSDARGLKTCRPFVHCDGL